jgi:hypothetical protein
MCECWLTFEKNGTNLNTGKRADGARIVWCFISKLYFNIRENYHIRGKIYFLQIFLSVLGSPLFISLSLGDSIGKVSIFIGKILFLLITFILYFIVGSAYVQIYSDLKNYNPKKDKSLFFSNLTDILVIIGHILLSLLIFLVAILD